MTSDQEYASTYRSPVDQLLRIGAPHKGEAIVDYSSYRFGREHVPELIRMLTDDALNNGDPESGEVWAPLHAWRVLGQLRAEEAVAPLLGLLKRIDDHDDDWVAAEVPNVLAEIGSAILFPAAVYLEDARHGEWARAAAADALAALGEHHAEFRDQCLTVLSRQLERFEEQSESLNAALISGLLDLKAVEAAPIMEKAFAAGRVDEFTNGDWEDVQIELGLKEQREMERKPNKWTELSAPFREMAGIGANENEPFFVAMPGTSLARLHFTVGERAGQIWDADLSVCCDPMCPCWMVEFSCRPSGQDEAEPLVFALEAREKSLILANTSANPEDRGGQAFGDEVVAAFSDRDWERLADYCAWDKEQLTEAADVGDLAGQFPEKLVGCDLAGYEEVFPFARSFVFDYDGHTWTTQDLYCIDRKCGCTDVNLVFLRMEDSGKWDESGDDKEGGLVQYDYRKERAGKMLSGQPGFPPVRELLSSLLNDYPDFCQTVAQRHSDMRYLNETAMRDQGLLDPVVRETVKVGRNDPCPCGSGKKYKKCCGK